MVCVLNHACMIMSVMLLFDVMYTTSSNVLMYVLLISIVHVMLGGEDEASRFLQNVRTFTFHCVTL